MITLQEMSMLSTLYTQPHRTYHNMTHIMECLTELENFPSSSLDGFTYRDIQIVEKTIWYHDAVYNPYSKENERQSALLLQEGSWYADMINKLVRNAIWATARHHVTQNDLSPATKVMLDIDLSGFGKSTSECLENGENVRREYYKTNDTDFYTGRLNFLRTIRKRESLYYTDYFKEKYHMQSQKNLNLEVEIAIEMIDDASGM